MIGLGVAIIGGGVVGIGPTTVVSGVRRLVDSATKAPQTRENQKSSQQGTEPTVDNLPDHQD